MTTKTETKKIRILPWVVWGIAASFFFTQYIARVAPSVMVPELMHHFSITAFAVGSLAAFFYYAYVPMQIPVGMLVDRFGVKRLLIMAVIFTIIGCFIFAETNSIKTAYFARLLLGFGASFSFISAIKLASVWFPPNKLGVLVGSTQALGMLGAVVGEAPIAFLIPRIGWRNSIIAVTGLFLILGMLITIFVKNSPSEKIEISKTNQPTLWQSLTTVLKNKQSWLNAIYAGTVYAPTAAFCELWGVSCLERLYHLSLNTAAFATSLVFIGWAIGSPIMGLVSDRIGKRKPLMYFSALSGAILLSLIFYLPGLSFSMLLIILFLFGITNAGVSISYTVASEQNPRNITGTSVSFANMASVLVGTICQPFIGWLLDLNWTGKLSHGIRIYSATNYRIAMLVLVICLVVGFIVTFFIKETIK